MIGIEVTSISLVSGLAVNTQHFEFPGGPTSNAEFAEFELQSYCKAVWGKEAVLVDGIYCLLPCEGADTRIEIVFIH